MSPFDIIEKLINEHASAAVMRDHLALLRDHIVMVEKKVVDLEKENSGLKENVHHLDSELESYRRAEEFVEHRDALFQRKPEGGYALSPRCPKCRSHMSSPYNGVNYNCECGHTAQFDKRRLKQVMDELRN